MLSEIPKPPYYAVIFTSIMNMDIEGYDEMAQKMEKLAQKQEGFIGIESARNKIGITVSYWKDLDAIKRWKMNIEHQEAQRLGRSKWYKSFSVRIAKVERAYSL